LNVTPPPLLALPPPLRPPPLPLEDRDCGWACIEAQHRLECAITLRAGEVVWDRHGMTCPHLQEIPEEEAYWHLPKLQAANPIPRLWRTDA
jgi:hypothetical protein